MSRLAIRVRKTLLVTLQAIGTAAISMPSIALSQDTVAGDSPALPMYRVEVLILRHIDQSRTTEEVRPQWDPELPADFNINGLDDDVDAAKQSGTASSRSATDHAAGSVKFLLLEPAPTTPDFVQLVPTQFELTEVWEKLRDIEAYEPVLHIAWLQPARGEAEAVPYDLVTTDADPDVVSGTLTLYKQRFVHFEVDLTMRAAGDTQNNPAGGFWSRFTLIPDNEDFVYRMHQSRRVRNETLQYFDHPRFGVIAAITELVVEEENAAETAAATP